MAPWCWLASCACLLAAALAGHNTPEEIRRGREALALRGRDTERLGWLQERVFGGFPTHVGMYPFAVYCIIILGGATEQCSASIVGLQWILSVAHCFEDVTDEGVIFAGDVDFTTDRVFTKMNIQIRTTRHSYVYKPPAPDHRDHDIAMVNLWRSFVAEHDYVWPIQLTPDKAYGRDFKKRCTIVGFGLRGKSERPETGIQRGASFVMEPGDQCDYDGVDINGFCTYDVKTKSACRADSGGPIFCAGEQLQYGIIMVAKYKNICALWCGAPVENNVHIFVGYYRDWITSFLESTAYDRRGQRSGSGQSLALSTFLSMPLVTLSVNVLLDF